jgi:hypothetical protein
MTHFPRALVLFAGALAAVDGGCSSCASKTSGGRAAKEDMALVPRETGLVFMANLGRLRDTMLWKRAIEWRDQSPENKHKYDDFVQKTGLDPLKQLDSIFLALPQPGGSGEFGVVTRGGPFDEARIVAYAKEQAQKEGSSIDTVDYGGRKLYGDKSGQAMFAFLDARTLLFGGKVWSKRMIDLADKGGDSAKQNDALMALVKRAHTADGIWGAGLVPQEVRDRFKGDPRLESAATMKDAYGSIDLVNGFALNATIDLGSDGDAKSLVAKVNDQLADAKKNPQVMMMGLAQYIDAIKAEPQGAGFHLEMKLTAPQLETLVNQLQGLFRSFSGALGGAGGGAPMGGPPPMNPSGMPPLKMAPQLMPPPAQ